MQNNQPQIDRLKSMLPSYLESIGINIAKPFRCLNPAHDDGTPSMSYYRPTDTVKCFGCDARGDLIDLLAIQAGITHADFNVQLEHACSVMGVDLNDRSPLPATTPKPPAPKPKEPAQEHKDWSAYIAKCQAQIENPEAVRYLKFRGITLETAKTAGLGFDGGSNAGGIMPWPAVVFPCSNISISARSTTNNKDKSRKHGPATPWGLDSLQAKSGPIVIVEGEFDALTLRQYGLSSIALGGVSNVQSLLNYLSPSACAGRHVVVALDADERGQEAQAKLLEGLCKANVNAIGHALPDGHKDPNELHSFNPILCAQWVKTIATAPTEALRRDFGAQIALTELIQDIHEPPDMLPTGFTHLDELMGGGLPRSLVVLGGTPSAGKTAFALQIADNLAAAGQPVMFFTLEMPRKSLVARSVSRFSFQHDKDHAVTDRDVSDGNRYRADRPGITHSDRTVQVINEAIGRYRKQCVDNLMLIDDQHRYTDIANTVRRYYRASGKAPVVIVDYLQIVQCDPDGPKEQRARTEAATAALLALSKGLDCTVLVLSSLGRASYINPGLSSFKESGGIEFSAHLAMILTLPAETEDQYRDSIKAELRRPVIKIVKNRYGSPAGDVKMEYHAKYHTMHEARFQ